VSSDTDGGTVPRRDRRRQSGRGRDGRDATVDAADPTPGAADASPPDDVGEGFGSRGWLLVAVVVGATLVLPGVIYLLPRLLGNVGLPYVVALLILPMLPAVVLGLTAVWTMRESNHR
jgi:hypothetical protein